MSGFRFFQGYRYLLLHGYFDMKIGEGVIFGLRKTKLYQIFFTNFNTDPNMNIIQQNTDSSVIRLRIVTSNGNVIYDTGLIICYSESEILSFKI